MELSHDRYRPHRPSKSPLRVSCYCRRLAGILVSIRPAAFNINAMNAVKLCAHCGAMLQLPMSPLCRVCDRPLTTDADFITATFSDSDMLKPWAQYFGISLGDSKISRNISLTLDPPFFVAGTLIDDDLSVIRGPSKRLFDVMTNPKTKTPCSIYLCGIDETLELLTWNVETQTWS